MSVSPFELLDPLVFVSDSSFDGEPLQISVEALPLHVFDAFGARAAMHGSNPFFPEWRVDAHITDVCVEYVGVDAALNHCRRK